MKWLLYTPKPPSGRCLLLADQLRRSTDMSDNDCMHMAQRLFDGQHPRDLPVIIDIPESKSADGLRDICTEFGISVDSAER